MCIHKHIHTQMKLLKQTFSDAFPSQSGRYPVAVVMIDVPPTDIDVNLEPNKTSVLLQNMVRKIKSPPWLSNHNSVEYWCSLPDTLY